jgi:hypothetical protein
MTTTLEPDTKVSKELAKIEAVEPKALTPAKAKQLDKQIRTAGEKLDTSADAFIDMLERAALGQIHIGLEVESWTTYVADVAKDNRFLQMLVKDKLQRKALAVKMSETGMSQRAIASAFGVAQKTIGRDLFGEDFESDTITSTDNRTMPREGKGGKIIDAEIVPEPEPSNAKRASVTEDFGTEVDWLVQSLAEMHVVIDDDRFPKARKRIGEKYLNTLQEAKADLEKIIDEVFGS